MITKKWGQGQLFAFSALDGDAYAGNDFVGYLSGDRIGIVFMTDVRRELARVITSALLPMFVVVTGDCICASTNTNEKINASKFVSKGKSTPFDKMYVQAKCVMTIVDGKIVFRRDI